jgi:hypothetical protein
MRILSFVTSAAVAAAFATPASAQYYRRAPIYVEPAPPYVVPGRAFYCQKLCPTDMSPCDPPEYKRADGRCTSPGTGRF